MTLKLDSWIALHPQSIDNVTVTPDNRGLAYADGFFTTMAVIDGAILWSDYHQQRLYSHAQALQLNINSELLVASLQAQAQQLRQGMIKLIVTRASQAVRGYGFSADSMGSAFEVWAKVTAMLLDTSKHLSLPDGRFVLMQPMITAICLHSQLACLPPSLAGLKSLNRRDSVLASGELQRIKATHSDLNIGLCEGLVRDMMGSWVEGTMSNVFYQLAESPLATAQSLSRSSDKPASNYLSSGQWYTPSMTQSGVAGVMRQVLIDALEATDNPVIVRSLTDDDLPKLSQLFFCNAVRGIMPVSMLTLLDGKVISF